jgi:hypothetical protein
MLKPICLNQVLAVDPRHASQFEAFLERHWQLYADLRRSGMSHKAVCRWLDDYVTYPHAPVTIPVCHPDRFAELQDGLRNLVASKPKPGWRNDYEAACQRARHQKKELPSSAMEVWLVRIAGMLAAYHQEHKAPISVPTLRPIPGRPEVREPVTKRAYSMLPWVSGEWIFIECVYELMGSSEKQAIGVSVLESRSTTEARKRQMRERMNLSLRAPHKRASWVGRRRVPRQEVEEVLRNADSRADAVRQLMQLGISSATSYRRCKAYPAAGKTRWGRDQ